MKNLEIKIKFYNKPILKPLNNEAHFFNTIVNLQGNSPSILFNKKTMKNRLNLITRIGNNYHCSNGVYLEGYPLCWNSSIVMMDIEGIYCSHPFICT